MDVYWNFTLWIENTTYQTHIQQVTSAGKDMDRREPSFTISGNVNWYGHHGELYGSSLKTIKNRTIIWCAFLLLGIHSEGKNDPKVYVHPNIHWSTFYNTQGLKAT